MEVLTQEAVMSKERDMLRIERRPILLKNLAG